MRGRGRNVELIGQRLLEAVRLLQAGAREVCRRSNGKITLWESEPAVAKRTANWIGRELSRVHSGMEWKMEVVGCSL